MDNKILITASIVIIGWVVAHLLTQYRERNGKRQNKKTEYLINAYRKVESSTNRKKVTRKMANNLESAIADIQLFGNEKQIKLAFDFSKALAKNEFSPSDNLLIQLREDLRKELKLSRVSREISHLRI